jgi:hyperosmotically inducible protein
MKPFVATLLASALTAAFASAYAADTKPDTTTYRSVTQKAAADYKVAAASCTGMSGNERAVCVEEAKVARARSDAAAAAQYNSTLKVRTVANTALANAEHALAVVKCSVLTAAEKDSCLANARSAHVAALADAKAGRDVRVATSTGVAVDGKGLIANTATTEPVKAAAVDKCAQLTNGQPAAGCLIDNKTGAVVATNTGVVGPRTETVAANTREAAATVAQKTENAVETAAQKTKNAGAIVADKTERAVDRVADAGSRAADKTEHAAAATGKVVADSVITTKIKADLFKEPELSAMAIHVETEKGVVMLSGFVDSKADAEKAVRLAKSVEGVTQVKSAIKVK